MPQMRRGCISALEFRLYAQMSCMRKYLEIGKQLKEKMSQLDQFREQCAKICEIVKLAKSEQAADPDCDMDRLKEIIAKDKVAMIIPTMAYVITFLACSSRCSLPEEVI